MFHFRIRHRHHYISLVLISLVGIAAAVIAFIVVRNWDQQKSRDAFEENAEILYGSLKREIEADLETVEALKAFYISNREVKRSEFADFTRSFLLRHKSIKALEWIPRIPHSQREIYEEAAKKDGFPDFQISERLTQGKMVRAVQRKEYFPVYIVEPYKGNEIALGFDLFSTSTRKKSLELSRDTGELVATQWIKLVQETGGQFGFLVFAPVYRKGTPSGSIQARRKNLEGFALGVFRIGDILGKALNYHKPQGINISLSDKSAKGQERFLNYNPSRIQKVTIPPTNSKENNPGESFEYAKTLDVGRRKWLILFTSSRDYILSKRTLQPWGVLLIGLMLTGIITGYLQFRIRHIEELSSANEQLKCEIAERKKAEEHISHQLRRLAALRTIDMAITSALDLRITMDILLEQVIAILRVDAASVLLLNPYTQMFEYAGSRGFFTAALHHTELRIGEGHAGRAALECRIVSIPNLQENPGSLERAHLLADEGFITYYGVPLIAKGRARGVLEIFHRIPFLRDQEWLDFLESLAAQAAIALDNATLFNDLQRSNIELSHAYDTTLEGWSRALDHRDKETEGHSRRVTEMTVKVCRAFEMSEEELIHVRRGALLHDIGKLGIPDNILLKPGRLTKEEWIIMKKHPIIAYELLLPISFLKKALDIPYCHHEKWDGTGYPRGIKGEQIPLAARIFAVVDVFDALLSDRPYRPAWPIEKVQEHIRSLSGTHFDPKVVEVFLKDEQYGMGIS